jgi:hypothetical protein
VSFARHWPQVMLFRVRSQGICGQTSSITLDDLINKGSPQTRFGRCRSFSYDRSVHSAVWRR